MKTTKGENGQYTITNLIIKNYFGEFTVKFHPDTGFKIFHNLNNVEHEIKRFSQRGKAAVELIEKRMNK